MKMKKMLSILLVVGMILSMMILPACEKSKGDGKQAVKIVGVLLFMHWAFVSLVIKAFMTILTVKILRRIRNKAQYL